MSFLRPTRRHTEFTFHRHDNVPEYEVRVADVKRAYNAMSETAQLIIPNLECSDIHIYPDAVPDHERQGRAMARYAPSERLIELPARTDMDVIPQWLHPIYSDFNYMAIHELHHPVIMKIAPRSGHNDSHYQQARKTVLENIQQHYPHIQDALDPILTALRECEAAEWADKPRFRGKISRVPGIGDDLPPGEQVAFYTGLMLSDEFHQAFGYTMDVATMKPDTTYDEDMCNIKALAHKFGREHVKTVAGALLTHVESREALYRQLLDTKTAFNEWQDTYGAIETIEWKKTISALENQFPGGDQGATMGDHSRGTRGA